MSEVALNYIELDWKTTAVSAVAQRVRLAVARSSLGVLVWLLLGYALRSAREIRAAVATADVRTTDERAMMAQFAKHLARSVALLDAACENATAQGQSSWLERKAFEGLEQICVDMEDVAETAALASSEAFAEVVERDLRESLVKPGADSAD